MYTQSPPPRAGSPLKRKLLDLAFETGLLRAGRGLWSRSLTVVNYHRIDDPERADFDSFRPNVSATRQEFERQMDYLVRWFHVISLRELAAWLDGRGELPAHAALITFDDGYLDNYTAAFPVLRAHGLPALIFLTTDHIGTDAPFYWDLAAYCFFHTRRERVTFPGGRVEGWSDRAQRERISRAWIESLKSLPQAEKQVHVARLPHELDVSVPDGYFRRLMMDWDQAREMRAGGIEFGAHTRSHPILTRIAPEEVRAEVEGSKARIEQELGEPVLGFAYPNGQAADRSAAIEQIVAGAGVRAAFTLINGPTSRAEVRRNPYAIRRIFISHRHSLADYALLLTPLNRYRSG